MSKTLLLWKTLFGEHLTPNDQEIIGVEADGTVIYYNATDGSCYNNGLTVDAIEDEEGKMNQREHIVTHPLEYLILTRLSLQACLPREGSKRGKSHKEIRAIVDRALSADPGTYVSNLKAEARYRELKKGLG